jgi:uncharacterized membrane protein YcaP (DUF421 family)
VNPGSILIRVVLAYGFMLIMLRLSGKRTIAQASTFEMVLSLIVGDLFDDLFWAEVAASQFVVAAGTLVLLHVMATAASAVSPRVEEMLEGPQRLLLRNGRPLRPAMRRERVNEPMLGSLVAQSAGLTEDRWPEIQSATLEQDGTLSVLPHDWARPVTREEADKLRKAAR